MRTRALLLLLILTFGSLSEAQPTPGGLKESLSFSLIVLGMAAKLYFQQNTRTLLHQGVGNRIGAGITGSLLHPPPRRTRPLFLSRHLHSSTRTTTYNTNSRLSAANNHGISDQNSQPNNNGTRPVMTSNSIYRLLNAGLANINRESGTNYHSYEALQIGLSRDPMAPLNGELALLGTNMGFTRGQEQSNLQAASFRAQGEIFADTTQTATAIHAYFNEQPWGIGIHLATMLRYLFRELLHNPINNSGGEPVLSANSLTVLATMRHSTGRLSRPESSGGSIGIAPIVSVVDLHPDITDQKFVRFTVDTVRVSNNHNHPHSIAAATAIALAARSSIDYRESLKRGQRPSRQEFAESTIARIRQHVEDDLFLYYLGIVEQNLDGSNSHRSVVSQLNRDPSRQAVANDEGVLNNMRAPNTTAAGIAAGLHFFFSETQSQQALLNLAGQYTVDRDVIGAVLMALSALRDGGIRRDEFSADEIHRLLEQFPEWVKIRRNPDIFLIDPPADKDVPPESEKKQD